MKYLLALSCFLCLLVQAGIGQKEAIPLNVQQLLDSAWHAYEVQDYPKMSEWSTQALQLAEQQQSEELQAESYRVIARAAEEQENWAGSFQNYRLALSIWEQLDNGPQIANISQDIAIMKDMEGDYELALNSAQRAVRTFEKLGDTLSLANALIDLANPNKSLGDYHQALMHFQRAHALFKSINDTIGVAITAYGLGDTYFQLKQNSEARPYLEEALVIFQQEEEEGKIAMAYNVLASIDEAEGRKEEAKKNYRFSSEWAQKASDSLLIFDANLNLAEMAANEGQQTEARKLLNIARLMLGEKSSMLDKASLDKVSASLTVLEKEIENKRLYQLLSLFLLLLFALGGVASWQYRKRKAHAFVLQQQMLIHQREVNVLLDDIQLSNESARVEGEKRERKKITKTLHDTVGSQLAATRWLQEANIEALKNGSLGEEDMQNVLNMMSEAYRNARNVERLLDKDSVDWAEEVSVFFKALSERSRLKVNYTAQGLENKLDWGLGLCTYKIVLTLAANVLIHANANHLNAQVKQTESGAMSIVVEDDGVGFDKNNIQYGSGLKNVEEYVKSFNGKINVEPREGKGTIITINIPAQEPKYT